MTFMRVQLQLHRENIQTESWQTFLALMQEAGGLFETSDPSINITVACVVNHTDLIHKRIK